MWLSPVPRRGVLGGADPQGATREPVAMDRGTAVRPVAVQHEAGGGVWEPLAPLRHTNRSMWWQCQGVAAWWARCGRRPLRETWQTRRITRRYRRMGSDATAPNVKCLCTESWAAAEDYLLRRFPLGRPYPRETWPSSASVGARVNPEGGLNGVRRNSCNGPRGKPQTAESPGYRRAHA